MSLRRRGPTKNAASTSKSSTAFSSLKRWLTAIHAAWATKGREASAMRMRCRRSSRGKIVFNGGRPLYPNGAHARERSRKTNWRNCGEIIALDNRGHGHARAPMTSRLSLQGITKRYPGVVANDGVSLEVEPGEIHAVLGENGAGKSTLMKVIYGAVRPDAGEIRWNGRTGVVRNPHEARALGIAMVFQHFSLFDTLTAAENVWLGLDASYTLASGTTRIRAGATRD